MAADGDDEQGEAKIVSPAVYVANYLSAQQLVTL